MSLHSSEGEEEQEEVVEGKQEHTNEKQWKCKQIEKHLGVTWRCKTYVLVRLKFTVSCTINNVDMRRNGLLSHRSGLIIDTSQLERAMNL
jgi:hypothetical protein